MPARCFFALLPDAVTHTALAALLPPRQRRQIPTRADALHLTLRFCAALPDASLNHAATVLPTLARALPPLEPLRLALWQAGRDHDVLAVLYRPHTQALLLVDAIDGLVDIAAGPVTRWQPHVTLARRYGGGAHAAEACILPPFQATALALVTSTPHDGRFVHHQLARADLPAGPAAEQQP